MGSNSSVIQQETVNQLDAVASGTVITQSNAQCTIQGVDISSPCRPIIVNTCVNNTKVDSTVVLNASVSATQTANTDQSAPMFSFLDFNSSTETMDITNILKANVGNSCTVINSVTAVSQNIKIYSDSRICLLPIKIYNAGQNEATCTLNTTMNLFSNADMTASVSQKTGGLSGSSGSGEGGFFTFLILMIILLFLAVATLFVFRRLKHER
jgi:hypothetical protein